MRILVAGGMTVSFLSTIGFDVCRHPPLLRPPAVATEKLAMVPASETKSAVCGVPGVRAAPSPEEIAPVPVPPSVKAGPLTGVDWV